MTADANQSDLQMIRIDGDSLGRFPAEVRHAAEVLVAFVAGLDQGLREAEVLRLPRPPRPRVIPPTDRDDLPGRPGARQGLEDLAEEAQAADEVAVGSPGGGAESGVCKPILGGPIRSFTQDPPPEAPEMVLVWGTGCYQNFLDAAE